MTLILKNRTTFDHSLAITEGAKEVMKVKVVKELYFNIVARRIKRFKTAVAMEFVHRDCDWFKGEEQDSELGPE